MKILSLLIAYTLFFVQIASAVTLQGVTLQGVVLGNGSGGVSQITLRASTTANNTGTTIQITVPTVSDGELLILSVVNDDGGTITTPVGWGLEGTQTSGSSRHSIFTRTASSEPANYTITNGGSTGLVAIMTSWQKPSGTWTTSFFSAGSAGVERFIQNMTSTDDDMLYIAWPCDAGHTIVDGPDDGITIGTPASNAVSIDRAVEGTTLSIDAYYEPFDLDADIDRVVEFSVSEDSAICAIVIGY
jgi:hypothetical protein